MTLHILTKEQEKILRVEYINRHGYDRENLDSYRQFAIQNVPGVIDAVYKDGDNPDYLEALLFDNEASLMWYLLRDS